MKSLKSFGKVLSKIEQREINAGGIITSNGQCYSDIDCCIFPHNQSYGYVCYNPGGGQGTCVPGIFWTEYGSCGS